MCKTYARGYFASLDSWRFFETDNCCYIKEANNIHHMHISTKPFVNKALYYYNKSHLNYNKQITFFLRCILFIFIYKSAGDEEIKTKKNKLLLFKPAIQIKKNTIYKCTQKNRQTSHKQI